jgi:hypothetical protein
MSSLRLLREFWRSERTSNISFVQFDSVTMKPLTAGPEAGPRLLEEYLNTNRKDFKISSLLDELDMKDHAERTEFQHFLRDSMTYDPHTRTGYQKEEFAELDDAHIRCYAEQFMDETKFKHQTWQVFRCKKCLSILISTLHACWQDIFSAVPSRK